jgi:UDPglucose 6-dehydrogenase
MEHFSVGVVGTGYVGLATGACLAYIGHGVTCLDNDQGRVAGLREGRVPFYEPGLEELIAKSAGRLHFEGSEKLAEVVREVDVLFVAVGTPQGGDGSAGEGSAVHDSLFPDRVVVGTDSWEALAVLRTLYTPIVEQSFPTEWDPRPKVAVPFVTTDLASAEMIKYASNAFLATKISFINEVANLCELVGADISEVAYGIGLDDRVGSRFLSAGLGWGGSCFPKDVAALRATARDYEYETPLLDAATAVNERQRRRVIHKLQRDLHSLKGRRVALLGLSFKPNTDDMRGAPSLAIAGALTSLGARVVGYDPVAGKAAARLAPDIQVVFDPYEALRGAHAGVVVTEWEELRGLDPKRAASLMRDPKLIVDGRNALDAAASQQAGLLYRGFGRGYDSG